MVSKARAKFIKSLQLKKYRQSEQAFLVEGTKSVREVLQSDFEIIELLATPAFLEKQHRPGIRFTETDSATLSKLGTFQTNDGALAVVRTKPNCPFDTSEGYTILLDGLNDPGNLGTLLRIADWYNINGLIASPAVPEFYNPKVIAASKGSFCRIPVFYTAPPSFLHRSSLPVFAADMKGTNVHSFDFPKNGLIIMGNESHGISKELSDHISTRITIPSYGQAESLNVSMAAAIICDNIRRVHDL